MHGGGFQDDAFYVDRRRNPCRGLRAATDALGGDDPAPGHSKMAARIDPEGVVQDAFDRARPRWRALSPQPKDVDSWVYGQLLDRLRDLIRGAMGPQHGVDYGFPLNGLAGKARSIVRMRRCWKSSRMERGRGRSRSIPCCAYLDLSRGSFTKRCHRARCLDSTRQFADAMLI